MQNLQMSDLISSLKRYNTFCPHIKARQVSKGPCFDYDTVDVHALYQVQIAASAFSYVNAILFDKIYFKITDSTKS